MPVGEIADKFDISRPAISQHLRVLKDAGLVTDTPVATQRLYEINPAAFQSLRAWLDDFWNVALGEFQNRVESRRATQRRRA
jgi:DNA-binding transcriptional ArsR family regulator